MNWPSLSLFSGKPQPVCKGRASVGAVTKMLLRELPPGRIAVIRHRDLDEMAAQELIDRKVKAVINCQATMSGEFPMHGPLLLLRQGIPLWEAEPGDFEKFVQHAEISIFADAAETAGCTIPCRAFTKEEWLHKHQLAQSKAAELTDRFIENTLVFAMQEKSAAAEPVAPLPLRTEIEGRHVLVVARRKGNKQELEAAGAYIRQEKPVLIGVDGGADTLLECGYKPHLIVGDMDSVSDRALCCGAELVVHAYRDGEAPGLRRVEALGLKAHVFPCIGTSEDAALLLAYAQRGEWIVTAGAHAHMADFLEKGRQGMGSTLLVRMKIGDRLIDIRGLGIRYRQASSRLQDALISILLSLSFVALSLLQLHWITRRLAHAVWKLGGNE